MIKSIEIEPILKKLNFHLEEAKKIYKALKALIDITGESINFPSFSLDDEGINTGNDALGIDIKPDQFYGKSNTQAAEEYLRLIGHSVYLDEIYEALLKGGIQFSGKDPKKSLYVSVIRAHKKFVKVGEGRNVTWGLVEFYPDTLKKKSEEKVLPDSKENAENEKDKETDKNEIQNDLETDNESKIKRTKWKNKETPQNESEESP